MFQGFKNLCWVAWRALISKKTASLSFMTWVSILGVAIGVASLVIVLSVMGGFAEDLKMKLLTGKPHMEIHAKNKQAGFSLKNFPLQRFQKMYPDAESLEPFTKADVVIKNDNKLATAELFGVDSTRPVHLWAFDQFMVDGSLNSVGERYLPLFASNKQKFPGIVLGSELATRLGVDLGDAVSILAPHSAADIVFSPNATTEQSFVVSGIFHSNLFKYDQSWAVVSIENGRKFMVDYQPYLNEQQYVDGIALRIKDPFRVDEFSQRLKDPKLQAYTWKEANKAYMVALKLEKYSMAIVLMLIVVVATFSISGTMAMTIFFRRGQIALLRSLGMSEKNLLRSYLMQGLFIGMVGVVIGLSLGVFVCFLISNFKFIPLPEGVYYLSNLPVRFLPLEYGVICGSALIMALIASVFPAYFAAKQNTSNGLRFL